MNRSLLAARILKIDGILLLVIAAIHFTATPYAFRFVSSQSSPEAFAQIGPPFLLSFILAGVLLLPIVLSTFYCADFFRQGVKMGARDLPLQCHDCAPITGCPRLTMPVRYFRAILFLIAVALTWIVAISMAVPLVLKRPQLLINGQPGTKLDAAETRPAGVKQRRD
jgi:hypothetical protein